MIDMNSKLPLRPRPILGESLIGFLMRAAHVNGYDAVSTVRQLFELKSTPLQSLTYSSPKFKQLAYVMSKRLAMEIDEIDASFNAESKGLYRSGRAVQNIGIYEPKICIACLNNGLPILAKWRIAHVTHCSIHKVALVKACPCCQAPLSWKPALFSHCTKCDTHWSSLEIGKSGVPTYQEAEVGLTDAEIEQYRESLYQVTALAMRFYDMQISYYRVFPSDIQSAQALFDFSYRLLLDVNFRKSHLEARVKYWKKRERLIHIPGRFFERMHAEIEFLKAPKNLALPDYTFPISLSEFQTHTQMLTLQRLCSNPEERHYQLRTSELATSMGLAVADISKMTKYGVIGAINEFYSARNAIYDVHDIDALLKRLLKFERREVCNVAYGNYITFDEAMSLLKRFNFGIAQVLQSILNGKCDFIIPLTAQILDYDKVLINREKLLSSLFELFFFEKDSLRRSKLSQFFYANSEQLSGIQKLILSECTDSTKSTGVTVESLKFFLARNVVLNQWCRLRKMKLPAVIRNLQSSRIYPKEKISSRRDYFIYEKNHKLLEVLNACLCDKNCHTITH